MKATVLVALFAAVVAAAPGSAPKRCGGKTGLTCATKEVCAGFEFTKDGSGVCVDGSRPCGDFFGHVCPGNGDWCANDPRVVCPPNVLDCGSGVCIPGQWVKDLGLKLPSN
ncbi:hypothetical protein TWF696_003325 [Orbilia brochopaga]|uniref:SSCRP protein n=1 Tax=Orbilia brochopaga TaxID=3140254 RepID=A0AAV9TY79_9PEZI